MIVHNYLPLSKSKIFLMSATWVVWVCVLFLPKLHERYTYLLDILLLLCFFLDKKFLPFIFVSESLSLITYGGVFGSKMIGAESRYFSLLYIATFICFSILLIKERKNGMVIPNSNKMDKENFSMSTCMRDNYSIKVDTNNDKKKLKLCKKTPNFNVSIDSTILKKLVLYTSIFFFITHGYAFLNSLYSHDSLMIFQNDGSWQVSLGRFLQPTYVRFRGMITAPLWVGICTFIYLSLSICLISAFFSAMSKIQKVILSGMLVSSLTLTLSNATYIPWSDIYMLALLFSTLGAYVAVKHRKYSFVSVISMSLSMGLYQAYIQVAVILLMFDVFSDVLKNKEVKVIVKKSAVYLSVIFAAFALYYVFYKLFLHIYHIDAATGYNGLSKVGHFSSIRNAVSYFTGTYSYVWNSFINPISPHKKLSVIANFVLLATGLFFTVFILLKNKLSKLNSAFVVLLLCLFPFCFNFIYFISQGMEHELMIYSFSVVPLFLLPLSNMIDTDKKSKIFSAIRIAMYAFFAVLIFNNVIFANQCYVKKDLEAKSTISIVTRIIDRIEQTEGYIPGETQVRIIGKIEANPCIIERRAGFNYQGAGNSGYATATYNIEAYIKDYLAYPMRFSYAEYSPLVVNELDVFPSKNCTTIRDGILYIKISGQKENVFYNAAAVLPDYHLIENEFSLCIDNETHSDSSTYLRGWAYHENDICRVMVSDGEHYWETNLEARPDVQKAFNLNNDKQGFSATIPAKLDGYSLYLINDEKKEIYKIPVR